MTGAISSFNSALINEHRPINVLDALWGQVPGLQIAQESGGRADYNRDFYSHQNSGK